MAVRKKSNPTKAKERLKLRAAILEVKEKKEQMADKERALRSQLRGL